MGWILSLWLHLGGQFLDLCKAHVGNSRPWTHDKLVGMIHLSVSCQHPLLKWLLSMTKKDKRNIVLFQPNGQQENTRHLSSDKIARDSWSDCQDKALIGFPCQGLMLISSPPSMKGKSPLNPIEGIEGNKFQFPGQQKCAGMVGGWGGGSSHILTVQITLCG